MTEEELIKKKKAKDKAKEKYLKLAVEIRKECFHPESQLEKKESYFDGSYNDTAYTQYWDECSICGKHLNSRTKDHGYYG